MLEGQLWGRLLLCSLVMQLAVSCSLGLGSFGAETALEVVVSCAAPSQACLPGHS